MTKPKLDAILVVEGATDKALIASFLDCEIVTVNGSAVSRETLDYLVRASKAKDVIVLTDPDSPGKRIRDLIRQAVPTALHAFIPKEKAIKRHKVGVAESDKETILEALGYLIPGKPRVSRGTLTYSDLLSLGLAGPGSEQKREAVEAKLHLGHGNCKTMLQRLNALGISRKELEEAING